MAPITLSIFFFFSSITTIHGLTIKTRLIHRDSYHSPLYDAAKTIADLANESLRSSVARHEHTPSLSDNGRGGVDAELVNAIKLNIFYANFSIGYPPVPQLGVMDTGSDFLWVKVLEAPSLIRPSPRLMYHDHVQKSAPSVLVCLLRLECDNYGLLP
ncbi:Probable aspartic protease At2g35615 [Linum perenne]